MVVELVEFASPAVVSSECELVSDGAEAGTVREEEVEVEVCKDGECDSVGDEW